MEYAQGGILKGAATTVTIRYRGECAICHSHVYEMNASGVLEHVITRQDVTDGTHWTKIGHYPQLEGQ
jgi:hypothetical protein